MNLLDPSITEITTFSGTERMYVADPDSNSDHWVEAGPLAYTDRKNTFADSITIQPVSTNPQLKLWGVEGTNRSIVWATGESPRWWFGANSTAETGSNAGSDFRIYRYSDAGTNIGTPLSLIRSTGRVGIGVTSPGAQLAINAADTSTVGLIVNAVSGATADTQRWTYGGATRAYVTQTSAASSFFISDTGLGTTAKGPGIFIGANTDGTYGAAGYFRLRQRDGTTARYIWLDQNNVLRMHFNAPTADSDASDTAGVSFNTTSNEAYKNLLGPGASATESLAHIRDAVVTIQRFTYKSGAYGNEEFDGVVVHNGDGLQRYGMDADAEHDGGKSLNEINAIADLMKVVAMQADQIDQLTARITELEKN